MARLAVVGTGARRSHLVLAFLQPISCDLWAMMDKGEKSLSRSPENIPARPERDVPELQILENQGW